MKTLHFNIKIESILKNPVVLGDFLSAAEVFFFDFYTTIDMSEYLQYWRKFLDSKQIIKMQNVDQVVDAVILTDTNQQSILSRGIKKRIMQRMQAIRERSLEDIEEQEFEAYMPSNFYVFLNENLWSFLFDIFLQIYTMMYERHKKDQDESYTFQFMLGKNWHQRKEDLRITYTIPKEKIDVNMVPKKLEKQTAEILFEHVDTWLAVNLLGEVEDCYIDKNGDYVFILLF